MIHTLWMLRDYEAVLASKVEAPLVVGFALVALGRENEALGFLGESRAQVAAETSTHHRRCARFSKDDARTP